MKFIISNGNVKCLKADVESTEQTVKLILEPVFLVGETLNFTPHGTKLTSN